MSNIPFDSNTVRTNQSFFDSITDGIICFDESGAISLINTAAKRMLMIPKTDQVISYETFLSSLSKLEIEEKVHIIPYILDTVRERCETSLELHLLDSTGSHHWVEFQTNIFDSDGERCYSIYLRDISRWKEAEENLNLNAEKLRMIFQYAYDAILIYELIDDYPSNFTDVNRTAYERLGYSRDELLLLSPFDLIPPSDLGRVTTILKQFRLQPEQSYQIEQATITGIPVPVEIHARMVRIKDRDYIVEISRDITDRKRLSELQHNAIDQIDLNMEQFAILNDRIRNPLGVIAGIASFDESKENQMIIDQVKLIDKLVDELDQGWIESEKVRNFLKKHFQ